MIASISVATSEMIRISRNRPGSSTAGASDSTGIRQATSWVSPKTSNAIPAPAANSQTWVTTRRSKTPR